MCVCVCVCACVRACVRARARARVCVQGEFRSVEPLSSEFQVTCMNPVLGLGVSIFNIYLLLTCKT